MAGIVDYGNPLLNPLVNKIVKCPTTTAFALKVKRFSEGFFQVEHPLKSAVEGYFDSTYATYAGVAEAARASRYLQVIQSISGDFAIEEGGRILGQCWRWG